MGLTVKLAVALVGTWLLVLALFGTAVADPTPSPVTSRCHAYSEDPLPLAAAEARLGWRCGMGGWEDGHAVTWLRFEGWDAGRPPRLFVSRITMFQSIEIAALDAGGAIRSRSFGIGDAQPLLAGPVFGLELPPAGPDTVAYVVRIKRAHSVTIGSEATLRALAVSGVSARSLVLLAIVLGMLLMPLLFDLMYFYVLRERFVLLHAAMVIAMIVYVLAAGGLITALALLPVSVLAIAGPLSWALASGIAGCFIVAFLEPGVLPRRMRDLVYGASAVCGLGASLCALQLDATQGFDNSFYFLLLLPLMPIYLAAIFWAIARGSRAARYLAVAYLPIFIAGAERSSRGMGLHGGASPIDHALFFALGLEVTVITLGVAVRFLSIRRERDQALIKARTLKQLSECDSLTGLYNRRIVEERFATLRQQGYCTFAILDLDHFKRINDTYGHSLGDMVLKVVGKALRPRDENLLSFRMGGEEFLLLLRGEDALERAERYRQEIARAVAHENLGCLVTASMGAVEISGDALPGAGFVTIYARADRLLYEAKSAGRNRMVSERIKTFRPRRGDRRAA